MSDEHSPLFSENDLSKLEFFSLLVFELNYQWKYAYGKISLKSNTSYLLLKLLCPTDKKI